MNVIFIMICWMLITGVLTVTLIPQDYIVSFMQVTGLFTMLVILHQER